jgi:hypothetical protein
MPTPNEIRDYLVVLIKIFEKTPSGQSVIFNDDRIEKQTQWSSRKVKAVREICFSSGWLRFQNGGSGDYALTPDGIESARKARRGQNLSILNPS